MKKILLLLYILVFNCILTQAQNLDSLSSNFDIKLECNLKEGIFTMDYIIDIKHGGFYYTNIFTRNKTIYSNRHFKKDTLFVENNHIGYFEISINDTLFTDLNYFYLSHNVGSIPYTPGIFFPCFFNELKTLVFRDKSRVTQKNMFHVVCRIDFLLDETEVLNFIKNDCWMDELRDDKKTIPVVGHFIVNKDYNSTQRGDRALEEKYRLNMDDYLWWKH